MIQYLKKMHSKNVSTKAENADKILGKKMLLKKSGFRRCIQIFF